MQGNSKRVEPYVRLTCGFPPHFHPFCPFPLYPHLQFSTASRCSPDTRTVAYVEGVVRSGIKRA